MRRVPIVAVSIALAAAVVAAAERMPLPVVDLMGADGSAVRSDAIARDGTWILIYVHRGCGSCEAPLAAIQDLDAPDANARIAIVADAPDAAALASFAGRYPALSGARWLGDSSMSFGSRIAPQAVATVVGAQGSTIEWTLAGVVLDVPQLRSVLKAWLDRAARFE